MSVRRRGTANTSSIPARSVEVFVNTKTSNIIPIEKRNFLEYFGAMADELSKQAVCAGEPFLAYLTSMASLQAKNQRQRIDALLEQSAA